MSGVLRLSNSVTGRSTIIASASNDQTFTLPALGGTLLAGGSSLEVIFPSGSEALPGLHVQGDTDTGLYAPAANTLGISTAGSERLRIASTGNVGIGTSNPSTLLHLAANAPYITFEDKDNNQDWQLQATAWFALRNQTTASELLRVTSAGLVGIGTSSPNTNLEVVATRTISSVDSFGQLVVKTTSGATGNMLNIGVDETNSRSFIQSLTRGTTSRSLLLNPYGGNVGINESNPDSALHVTGPVSGTILTLDRAGSYSWKLGQSPGSALTFTADTSERLRIDISGNVGIGTTSPSFRLHSYDTTAAQGFFNGWSSGGTFDAAGAIRFGNQTSYQGRIDFDPSGNTNFIFENSYLNGSISWKINGGEKARLLPTGQLLVGTSSPFGGSAGHCFSADESISGTGAVTVLNTNTGASNPAASFGTATNSSATTNFLIKFFVNGFAAGSGAIVANGTSQAAFATYSDRRLKENIVELPSQLENIKNLRPVEFDYIDGGHQIGFIAQEFENVYPDAVGLAPSEKNPEEERLTITGWSKTEAYLVKALQEAITKIETLEQRLTDAGL